ncbi:MAG TPA: AMP-binding protein [Quisquiliibacterium sp.]|nr:AMP-binding protein [Quisquiliibacterium sp.]
MASTISFERPVHPDRPAALTDLLAQRAAQGGVALFDRDRPVTYADLLDESARLAGGLLALGVRPGDRVAIWLPNVPAWLTCFFACARIGAIALAVNTRFRSGELADILKRSGAKLLVTWPGFDRIDFADVLAGCPAEALSALEGIVAYGEGGPAPSGPSGASALPAGIPVHAYDDLLRTAAPAPVTGSAADGCAIFTTSGTTKAPKFVLHDQRTLVFHAFDVVVAFDLDPQSTMLLAPPLCGVFGVCCALAMFAAGRPLLMMPTWDAAAAARMIDAHGATHMNATDDAIAQLLAQNTRTPAFPTLRFVAYAAFNPALGDIVETSEARGLKVVGLYGISEIQALFARNYPHEPTAQRKLGGGIPVSPLARVRARDPETGRVLPHGEAGELEFFAPGSRMVEYFGNPAATAEALFDGGWYRSGDLGYTCADGRFVFLTRIGDSLRLGGFLVSPQEIEDCVQEVAGIDGCQVVAATLGTALRPIAFVTLKPGATLDEAAVIAHVGARLARFKVPVRVFAIDAFPVTEGTNATKIQKHRLRDLAQARLAAEPPA